MDEQAYVEWLREPVDAGDGGRLAGRFSATAGTSHNPFADPEPASGDRRGPRSGSRPIPMSMVTKPAARSWPPSAIDAVGRVRAIGIDGVHTGPVKRAGGLSGGEATPSVDGYFDRISTRHRRRRSAPRRSSAGCARSPPSTAAAVIDDIVPGHTGKGADFRLAEMKVGDYPGIYHMVEIPPADWHLLPDVPAGPGLASTSTPTPRTG